ncbi:phosphonate C-P lyase system protein PhnH [Maledivibacter halophilus]|uniref:Alpha-D-ribose 1-methylphosphonate 5-triphosphate synthase subunit PhnH n=1 Tax=Maledivibacter halophilus TaxID=36842 RepID=A0A1T5J8Y9_9FIRM|nr:phosphonate C-P lyase system protein PhnH [Maledivibacter halophilus]SKC47732.1 alpha-D-ribose 1-methylphosphonate 5-triphosphate synthase subunit PhnH [Maledivibacter halophilus]
MKVDLVHDIQKAYRNVVESMSRPGLITNISKEANKVDLDIEFYNSTLVLMLMLLDAEVSFKVFSENEEKITKLVSQLTYAKPNPLEKSSYVFIMKDSKTIDIEEAFEKAYGGNLIDPHKSATIIIEANNISNDKELILKGPGIKDKNYIKVDISGNWVEKRELKNIEYPLGVDTIIIDKNSNLICLPRTTQISK